MSKTMKLLLPAYEAPRNPNDPIRVRGIGRDAQEPRAMLVLFTDIPTDDEMRRFHDYVRDWGRDG